MNPIRTPGARKRSTAAALAAMSIIALALSACADTNTPAADAPSMAAMAPLSQERITEIITSPTRTDADRRNDERRKPAQVLNFLRIEPDMMTLDLFAGGGYTSELLARAVGPNGRVYAQNAPRDPNRAAPAAPEGGMPLPPAKPGMQRNLTDRAAIFQNIVPVSRPFEDPVPKELNGKFDLVTLMFNYHDFGHMGVDRAKVNQAVFAALKRGGTYVIADHAGRDGTGISESGTLHRVEEGFVRAEVEAAGFKFKAEGNFARNPNDPRDKNTPDPLQPKDEFYLKFVKP